MSDALTMTTPDANPEKPLRSNGKFTLYSVSDFPSLPEIKWRIDGILPSAGLGCVYGPSTVGKSFFCLDMAASVAGGTNWFGHPTTPCQVVYLVLENQVGFRSRVTAWEKHHGVPFPENVQFVFDEFAIDTQEDPQSLGGLIHRWDGAGLVIIDTLNKAAPRAEENSSSDMGNIIAGASVLQKVIGGFVILVHHPGKDATRGLRGHSSLFAALDTVIEVKPHGMRKMWTLTKSKDGESNVSQAFDLVTITLGNSASGKVNTSCAVEQIEGIVTAKGSVEPSGKHQKPILTAATKALVDQKMQCELGMQDAPAAGIPFEEMLSKVKDTLEDIDQKHRRQRAKEALTSLINQGYLTREGDLLALPAN